MEIRKYLNKVLIGIGIILAIVLVTYVSKTWNSWQVKKLISNSEKKYDEINKHILDNIAEIKNLNKKLTIEHNRQQTKLNALNKATAKQVRKVFSDDNVVEQAALFDRTIDSYEPLEK